MQLSFLQKAPVQLEQPSCEQVVWHHLTAMGMAGQGKDQCPAAKPAPDRMADDPS